MTEALHTRRRSHRRNHGAYYTPAPIARHILQLAMAPLRGSSPPALLDPACGQGVFLLEAARLLAEESTGGGSAAGKAAQRQRLDLVRRHLFGVDIDCHALLIARQQLAHWIAGPRGDSHQAEIQRVLERNLVHANALLAADDPAAHHVDSAAPPLAASALVAGGKFDCVVGNPPYINSRLASQTLDANLRTYYAQRYQSACGAYDLYVLFLERALQLLRPGGRYAWIIPNKLAGADYAAGCRELLQSETTLDAWEDLSEVRVFAEAGVYPQIIAGTFAPPEASAAISRARWQADGEQPLRHALPDLPHAALTVRSWQFSPVLNVESRIATRPLGELVTLHSGATGFQAQALAAELQEADANTADAACYRFITSGNIDRYQITDTPVRFMRKTFTRAMLSRNSRLLSENKRRLYEAQKLVIAGMTRRLEVAYDQIGRALGVQVYAAIDLPCDPFYLLGLLNSRLLSHLFRQRMAAKRLAGGYLSINKSQLTRLPVVVPCDQNPPRAAICSEIGRLGRQLHRARAGSPQERIAQEAELDALVCQLYGVAEENLLRFEDPR